MKPGIYKLIILLAGLTLSPSAHAMLVRASHALGSLRSSFLTRGASALATESSVDSLFAQNPMLLSRSLATQHVWSNKERHHGQQDNQSEGTGSDQGHNHSWWQAFNTKFIHSNNTPMFGFSIFGYKFFTRKDDICQTEEDFQNPEKLNLTKEYFNAGGKDQIFDMFIQKFETLQYNPTAANKILEFFAQTFEVFQEQPDKMKALEKLVFENFSSVYTNPSGKKIIEKLSHRNSCFRLKMHSIELILNSSAQTAQHFKVFLDHNVKKINSFFPNREQDAFAFMNIVHTVMEIEEQEAAKGNYTFVHAHRWNIHFLQDLDTHLRSAVYGSPKLPLSLRFNKPSFDLLNVMHIEKRKQIMETGVPIGYHKKGNIYQPYVTFLNYALFANQYGSNTMQYIRNNRCERNPQVLLDMVFGNHGLKKYQKKYAKEIKELETLHNNASKFGSAFVLSFSPKMLKECVYAAAAGGPKRTIGIEDIGETDDVQLVLDTLRSNPEKIHNPDQTEFVFVVTDDCGFNAKNIESGDLKIIPINASDDTLYKEYEHKRDALIAKIKRDINIERAKWDPTQRRQYTEMLQSMNEWAEKYNCLNACNSRVQEALQD